MSETLFDNLVILKINMSIVGPRSVYEKLTGRLNKHCILSLCLVTWLVL